MLPQEKYYVTDVNFRPAIDCGFCPVDRVFVGFQKFGSDKVQFTKDRNSKYWRFDEFQYKHGKNKKGYFNIRFSVLKHFNI
jgi:hypothetical protein